MPTIVTIAEGDGEVEAAPLLVRRLLHEVLQRFELGVPAAKNAHGRENLIKEDGVERFVKYALHEPDAAAVVVVLDAEQDAACALACQLRARIQALNPRVPVAVVCADVQYESWFVDSIETLAGHCGLAENAIRPDRPPPNPKRWLCDLMPSARAYKETRDQAPLTARLDFSLLAERSRSFRRMRHAVEELVEAYEEGTNPVTPLQCPDE